MSNSLAYASRMGEILTQKICRGSHPVRNKAMNFFCLRLDFNLKSSKFLLLGLVFLPVFKKFTFKSK